MLANSKATRRSMRSAIRPFRRASTSVLPTIHDGFVLRVSVEERAATVVIKGDSGQEYAIHFVGVEGVEMRDPVGMELYSLSEMRAKDPLRAFAFTNNSEDECKSLSIIATGFQIISLLANGEKRHVLDG